MNKAGAILLIVIISIMLIHVETGCANIIPPTGGPRDSLPPVLVSAVPKDSTTHFHSKTIVLTFDEYVQLDEKINEQFIVSPNPDNPPFPENRLKTVTVKLRDSLKPNTTYSLDFGNTIKDINEGNPLRNFTYVFSTGSTIDDGTISGNVTLAETGEADSTLIVLLHSNLQDSAVKKTRPDYYTRLDSGGNFRFRYLPHETFNIYVLPNDYSKRYDDSTKMFAFYHSTVNADSNNTNIRLFAYQQVKKKEEAAGAPTTAPAAIPSRKKPGTEERLRYSTNLEGGQQDILDSLEITLSKKITKFDSSKVLLTDTSFRPVTGYTISRDTTPVNFFIHFNWPENQSYKLVLEKDAFADSTGLTLPKNDTISFTTKGESQYGSIRLQFNNLDLGRNPVLEFVQDDKIIRYVPLTATTWYQRLFEPGDYDLRILYDDNKNGRWDPGNFDEKRQPEIVRRIPRKLTIKANWDNEVEINL